MDQRGQAYSTFKLLIAAIVAMAMLAILIPIIMQAMGWLTNSPINETKSLISDLIGSPGALRHTPEVAFKPNEVLAASALVVKLGISDEQICMSTGEFEEDATTGFECMGCEDGTENQRLFYHGKSNMTAKIAIVCNVNLDEIKSDIEAYKLDDLGGNNISDACQVCEGKGKCCAIVLKRS